MIELLLVLGIISVLAAIVMVAINPQKQVCSATDAKALQAATQIQRALDQYLIDARTGYPATFKTDIPVIPMTAPARPSCMRESPLRELADAFLPVAHAQHYSLAKRICSNNVVCSSNPDDCVCLKDILVPKYIVAIPQDTRSSNVRDSGFEIGRNNDLSQLYVRASYLGQKTTTDIWSTPSSSVVTWKASAVSGQWSSVGNWDLRVPLPTDDVVIPSSTFNPTLSADGVVINVTIKNGATLIIAASHVLLASSVTVQAGGTIDLSAASATLVTSNLSNLGTGKCTNPAVFQRTNGNTYFCQ